MTIVAAAMPLRATARDGASIAYNRVGDGPPILFVAGTGYPGTTWWPPSVEALARVSTVITYDHRGTGASSRTPGPYSTRDLARDAADVLQHVGAGPAHVVGHSMGGRVAQWLALDAPAAVRSLLLAGTGAGAQPHDPDYQRGVPVSVAVSVARLGYRRLLDQQIARTFFTSEFSLACPERVQWLQNAFWARRPPLEDYLKHVAARQNHQAFLEIVDIRVPTLVVVGSRDIHSGGTGPHLEQSEVLAQRIAGAQLHVLPGLAHGLFWEDPGQMERMIGDWSGSQSATR